MHPVVCPDGEGQGDKTASVQVDAKTVDEAVVRHYVPETGEEKHLDRKVNAKLDADCVAHLVHKLHGESFRCHIKAIAERSPVMTD